MDGTSTSYLILPIKNITAFSHFGNPVDDNALLRALFSVSGNGRTEAFAKFHLARTHVVQAIAIKRLGIDDLVTS